MRNAIQEILLHDWDPIGIGAGDAPRDEYDAYIGPLVSTLSKRPSENAIVRYLVDIEQRQMGLKPDPDRARRVAARLIGLAQKQAMNSR